MKKSLCILLLLSITFFGVFAGAKTEVSEERLNEVVVYAYDSFIAEWGPGPELVRLFEEKTGYTCEMIAIEDILSRVVLEKDAPVADVVIGLDMHQAPVAFSHDILESYKPQNADSIIAEELIMDSDWRLTPYDWGHFAINYDTESNVPKPASLEDLTDPIYKNKLVLMDPRTSTPGLGFLAWTIAIYGDDYVDYWNRLSDNILSVTPGWSEGYGLYTAGEAPLVLSYTCSPAYHVEYEDTTRYEAIIFEQGHVMQIEGAGLVKNAPNSEGGKAFIDFLITEEAQDVLPLTQWMNPVNENITLPASYEYAPIAEKTLTVDVEILQDAATKVMNELSK